MKRKWIAPIERIIPDELRQSPEAELRARILVWFSLGLGTVSLSASLVRLYFPLAASDRFVLPQHFAISALFFSCPLVLRAKKSLAWPTLLCMSASLWLSGATAFLNGGLRAPGMTDILLLPVIVTLLAGWRVGLGGLTAVLAGFALIRFSELHHWVRPLQFRDADAHSNAIWILYSFLAAGSYVSGLAYEKIRVQQEKKISEISRMGTVGMLAGGVAHEINNPLMVIIGVTRRLKALAKESAIDAVKLEAELEKIDRTAERIQKIVGSLLTLSRSGKENEPLAPVEVQEIVGDSLLLCRELSANRGIELRVDEVPSSTVHCRAAELVQVVLNLVGNAMDAVETLEQKWVHLHVAQGPRHAIIAVTDSGKGIPPEIAAKMLLPFFTTKGAGRGTGLGLSICKEIVEAHGGKLRYDAACPNTRFVIELPLA